MDIQDIFSIKKTFNKKYKLLTFFGQKFRYKIKYKDELRNYNPLISVIVPNFNHAKFLKERLDSIYSQSYKNIEVILLDDCSTDNSREILSDYAKKYPDITRLEFNNKNSASIFKQWQKGLKLAKGELIWIAESDDYCSENFLKETLKAFKDESVMISYARSVFVNSENEKVWSQEKYLYDLPYKWKKSFVDTTHNLINNGFIYKNIIPNVSGALIRNTGFEEIFNNEVWLSLKLTGDWLFYLTIAKGGKIAYNTNATNYYRQHDDNTSLNVQKQDTYYEEYQIVSEYIIKNFKIEANILYKVKDYLKSHWQYIRGELDEQKLDKLYDINYLKTQFEYRKPNVLMFIYSFISGGGETLPIFIANQLRKDGIPVTILNYHDKDTDFEIKNLVSKDIPIIDYRSFDLEDIVKDFGIDIIQTQHGSVDWEVAKSKNILPKKCKHIVVNHGFYELLSDDVLKERLPIICSNADIVLYTADKNLEPYKDFVSDKFFKISNGLFYYKVNPISRESLNIPNDAFVICLCARGIPEKGWRESIEAVNIARNLTDKNIHLIIIGSGDVYDEIKNSVPDYIHLLGRIINIRDYYSISDMGLVASRFKGESFPLVIIDALFCDKPVIGTNVGEIKNMLTCNDGEVAGEIFELDNWQIPIEKLAKIIANFSTNKEKYQNAVSVVKKIKSRYDIKNVTDQYLKYYLMR